MAKLDTKNLQGLQRALTNAVVAGLNHAGGDEPSGGVLFAKFGCSGNKQKTERALKAAFTAGQAIKR